MSHPESEDDIDNDYLEWENAAANIEIDDTPDSPVQSSKVLPKVQRQECLTEVKKIKNIFVSEIKPNNEAKVIEVLKADVKLSVGGDTEGTSLQAMRQLLSTTSTVHAEQTISNPSTAHIIFS